MTKETNFTMRADVTIESNARNSMKGIIELVEEIDDLKAIFNSIDDDLIWSGRKKEARIKECTDLFTEVTNTRTSLITLKGTIEVIYTALLNANAASSPDNVTDLSGKMPSDTFDAYAPPGTFGGVMRSPFGQNYDIRLNSDYGVRNYKGINYHQGMDLVPVDGKWDLYALGEGEVVKIWTEGDGRDDSVGNGICIRYPDPLNEGGYIYVEYFHMAKKPSLSLHDTVSAGDIVGKMGDSGSPGAYHLHLSIRKGDASTANLDVTNSAVYKELPYTDPAPYFFDIERNYTDSQKVADLANDQWPNWATFEQDTLIAREDTLPSTVFKSQTPEMTG